MNVLIVDDERDMRELIALMLKQANITSFFAEDGRHI